MPERLSISDCPFGVCNPIGDHRALGTPKGRQLACQEVLPELPPTVHYIVVGDGPEMDSISRQPGLLASVAGFAC